MKFRNLLAVAAVSGCLVVVACGGDDGGGDDDSANTCETGVSFQMVGKPFVEKYCQDCHSADADESLRVTAEDVLLDDEEGIREHGQHVWERVQNETMPPAKHPDQPTTPERADFLDWLDCSGIKDLEHEH
jgi:uncharacterized membrane protein